MTSQRRRRIWTSQSFGLSVTTAGVPGQTRLNVGTNYLASAGIASMAGITIAHTHIAGVIESAADNAGVQTENLIVGLGIFPNGMDAGDFPALDFYNGDWFGYGHVPMRMPGVIGTLVLPEQSAKFSFEYRSQRKVPRNDESPFLVLQLTTGLTGGGIDITGLVSMLLLLP